MSTQEKINDLKSDIVRPYGSQKNAARAIKMQEARLSRLIKGTDKPTQRELEKLSTAFGPEFCFKLGQLVGMSAHEASRRETHAA